MTPCRRGSVTCDPFWDAAIWGRYFFGQKELPSQGTLGRGEAFFHSGLFIWEKTPNPPCHTLFGTLSKLGCLSLPKIFPSLPWLLMRMERLIWDPGCLYNPSPRLRAASPDDFNLPIRLFWSINSLSNAIVTEHIPTLMSIGLRAPADNGVCHN